MKYEIVVDRHDRDGIFVAVIETGSQAPIVLETEGEDTSFDAASDRAKKAMGGGLRRWCICRLVPVAGNDLLALDLKRLQK